MSKLLYTTAISLLTSSAMAMTSLTDASDTLTLSHEQVNTILLNSYENEPISTNILFDDYEEVRQAIDQDYIKATEALSACEPNQKPQILNRFMSVLAFYGQNLEQTQKADLFLNYLSLIKNDYGALSGTAHIILGDLNLNATTREQEKIRNLLDGESIEFTAKDVFVLHAPVRSVDLFKIASVQNIINHRRKTHFSAFYATLFQPYMISPFYSYLPEEKTTFRKVVELFDAELQHVSPKIRHRVTQKLNVLAMFESGLAEQSTDEALSELYIRMKSGQTTSALATIAALEKWDIDDTREDNVAMCIQALNTDTVKSYQWVEDDLKDYLEYRLSNPDIEMSLHYSEGLITESCKKVVNGEYTIEEAAHAITHEWLKKDLLDNAIADCVKSLNEAKIAKKETSLLQPQLRIVYYEDSKKRPEKFKRDKKKNAKSKEKIRSENRRNKYSFLFEPSEDSSDNLVTPARVTPETRKVEHDVASLLDFAMSNKSGRSSTYEWDEQINDKYISEAIKMLWQIKDRHGELPGVAQILLGDLWPIVKREDHDQNVIGLLDNKHPTFAEEDVELLLSGIDGDSPLDVISIKNIETYCTQDNPIVLYAALLKPYMRYRVLEHSKKSEDDLAEIMNFIGRSYQSLGSDERQEITAKLNIMAIFESGLAREYADTTVYGEFIQQLSDEIEGGERSVQDATDALVRQLDYDNTLNGEVDQCVHMLAEEGYQTYVWEDDEDDVNDSDNATASSLGSEGDEETDYSDAEEVAL